MQMMNTWHSKVCCHRVGLRPRGGTGNDKGRRNGVKMRVGGASRAAAPIQALRYLIASPILQCRATAEAVMMAGKGGWCFCLGARSHVSSLGILSRSDR